MEDVKITPEKFSDYTLQKRELYRHIAVQIYNEDAIP